MSGPQYDPEQLYEEAKSIVSVDERKRFLKQACGDDRELLQRLESLLKAGERAESFFKHAAQSIDAPTATTTDDFATSDQDSDLNLKTGDSIGPYKLLEKLGEGGFGVVWAAEQRAPIRQRVALKVIKVGMDTKQVIARFEAERQALALMNHPNIAKVMGAGNTENGRPYFCMELIRGIPITQYCDDNKLPPQERLSLFVKVCNAIQHAHQKGVIHRDIKPGNILVTLHDGVPIPKVIDFGVAKAVEMELTEKTIYTQLQQFIGTPAYMSPEQAEMSGLDIDTRSDIYSLGVLLYELLTGRTPFSAKELMQSGLDEMRRIIRERDPDRPSHRLSSLQAADRTTTAHRRNSALPDLIRSLRGDLDWIVLKALEKDRTRRYETANGLAADVKRHLENEPITARPPSALYQLQKTWKRNRTFCTAAAMVFISLCGGLSFTLWQYEQAREARDQESAQRTLAEEAQAEAQTAATLAGELQREAEANERKAVDLAGQMERLAETMRLQSYVSDMNVAHHALVDNNRSLALDALNRHRPGPNQKDLRDITWRYLWTKAQGDELSAWAPYDGITSAVTFSPDGAWIATYGFDGKIRVYSTHSAMPPLNQEPVAIIKSEFTSTALVSSAVFSPNSTHLAFIQDGSLSTIETSNWKTVNRFGHAWYPIDYSSSGRYLGGTSVQRIRIWDLELKKLGRLLTPFEKTQRRWRWGWAFSADERQIYMSAQSMDAIRVLDIEDGSTISTIPIEGVSTLSVSPSGRLLACVDESDQINVWSIPEHKLLSKAAPQIGTIFRLAFSPDETLLATSSTDQLVSVWSLPTLEKSKILRGHNSETWDVKFSPDGKTLVSAGKEARVLTWDVQGIVSAFNTSPAWKKTEFHNINGATNQLLSREPSGGSQIWRISAGAVQPGFPLHITLPTEFEEVHFSPDGEIVTLEREDSIEILDSQTGRVIKSIATSQLGLRGFSHVTLSPDQQWIMAATRGAWHLIRTEPLATIAEFPAPKSTGGGYLPEFSPDGALVAFPTPRHAIRVWDLLQQKERFVLQGHSWTITSSTFSPEGHLLVTASNDGQARIWNVETGALHVPPLQGHIRGINRVEFSPDGRTLLSGGDDTTVRFWNVATGQEMLVIPDHRSPMLSEDGNTLVLYKDDQSIECVRIPTLEAIDRVEGRNNPR